MLSKAASLGKLSKEDEHPQQENAQKAQKATTTEENGAEKLSKQEKAQDDDIDMEGGGEDTFEHHNAWQRDSEKERDKILGFFTLSNQLVPRDIFHWIMSFIDPFPHYFMLRSVCSQWLYEFQEQVYDQVRYLNLLDDGSQKYYFRSSGNTGSGSDSGDGRGDKSNEQKFLVQFKPIVAVGRKFQMSKLMSQHFQRSSAETMPIYRFLGQVFSNVTHLRLGWRCISSAQCLQTCLTTLIPLLKQLETLEILNTKTTYPNHWMWRQSHGLCAIEFIALATLLPPSVHTLKLVGFYQFDENIVPYLKLFSKRGRTNFEESHIVPTEQLRSIEYDVQHLNLEYFFMSNSVMFTLDCKAIKELYPSFDVSAVQLYGQTSSHIPSFSMNQYIEYMSKKQGVMLKHMDNFVACDQIEENTMEMFIDTAVREYEQLKPLIDLPGNKEHMVSLNSLTKPGYSDFKNSVSRLKAFELLTNANRTRFLR